MWPINSVYIKNRTDRHFKLYFESMSEKMKTNYLGFFKKNYFFNNEYKAV